MLRSIPLLSLLFLSTPAFAADAPEVRQQRDVKVDIPDVELVDQDGRRVRLYSDLIKGHTVAVNFVFTTCTTICSPMTAVFGRLQKEVGERLGKDVHLVTLSLDPRTDTPERLREYADKFGRKKGWHFLTGPNDRMTEVLKALGGYVAKKESHQPVVLLGHEPSGRWSRTYGLASATQLATQLREVEVPSGSAAEADRVARDYFTDTELVDQHGKPHRFYSDLIRGKKVMINFAFASCKTACSPITANLARVQKLLGDQVGRDVNMITVTVDPANDTPARLKAFSEKFKTGNGWYFLSGSRQNVEKVLRKLGGYVDDPEQHLSTVLIGDSRTGNWVKAVGMSPPENLANAVEHIDAPTAP